MATFQKRGDAWRAIVRSRGISESATFGSKMEARKWATERESEIGKGGAATTTRTLRNVLEAYSAKVSPTHAGCRWEQIRIAKILREFGPVDRPLRDLNAEDVSAWRDARLARVAGPSVAREMGLLRAALAHAEREWKYLTRQTLDDLRGVRKPKSAPPRRRRILLEDQVAITDALGYDQVELVESVSQRVAVAFLLAIETGMRCGELCGIRGADLHLDRRVAHLPKTKNGDERDVPLSAEAVRLFRSLPAADPAVPVLDLTPARVDAMFRKYRPQAQGDIHFHDSRAEALTRLSKKVDVLTLARIIGHRDPRSLMVYYRVSAEEIAALL